MSTLYWTAPTRAATRTLVAWALSVCQLAATAAAADDLPEPFPSPSSNAALHYNRAMLCISMIAPETRDLLTKPIWDEVRGLPPDQLRGKLSTLLHEGRHALRAALLGCQQNEADFGLDYGDSGVGAMPHVDPMLQVGRLITLAGLDAQLRGDWKRAGTLFFYGLRLGRHMTHQATLAEALTGVEILENNYFALANCAVHCPDRYLVKRAFTILEIYSEDMVSPATTLLREARIVSHRCNKLKEAFPDGPWAEMLLEALGEFVHSESESHHEQQAIELCVKRGVPRSVFTDKKAFDAKVTEIQNLWVECFEATAAAMLLPAQARAERGRQIFEEYNQKLSRLGDSGMLDPAQIGNVFAVHDAELAMARLVLAAAASRTEAGFPASLHEVAGMFGGSLPVSPYDNSPIRYAVTNGGKDITVAVGEVNAGDLTLPKIEFSSMGN
jgi:hypothetical protein